ncbi:MAG: thioredoxin family protein [Planctomycetota bacterium]
MLLSLLVPFSFALPAESTAEALPIEPRLVVGEGRRHVASAQVRLEPFRERAGRATTELPQPDGPISLVLRPRPSDDSDARGTLWVDVDRDGVEDARETLTLGGRAPGSSLEFVSLVELGLPLEIMLYDDGDLVGATALTHYHHEVDVAVDDAPWRIVVVDADLDRTISSGDRWLALDARQREFVSLPSVYFASHPVAEPSYVSPTRALRLTFGSELSLEVAAMEEGRHEFLARRAARDNERLFKTFDEGRSEFLGSYEIDPTRPVDPDPPTWYHARDLEEALQVAKREGRPLWVEFMSNGCPWCKRYEWLNDRDAEVTDLLREFTLVRICRDMDPGQTAAAIGLDGVPSHALFDDRGEATFTSFGWMPPGAHARRLMEALDHHVAGSDD